MASYMTAELQSQRVPTITIGVVNVNVSFQEQHKQLRLLVVGGDGPSLLGHDWLSKIKLNWKELHHIDQTKLTLEDVLDKHSQVFREELGMVRGVTAKLHIDPQARPKFTGHDQYHTP